MTDRARLDQTLVERAAFPKDATLKEGAVFMLTDEEERHHQAVIVGIEGDDLDHHLRRIG